MATDAGSRGILIGIGAAVVVLIAVAIVLAVQPPSELDSATPEGTAQAYFRAVLGHDADDAFTYLAPEIADRCDIEGLRHEIPDDARIVITRTEIDDTRARVEVEITESYAEGPFDAGSDTFDETLIMESSGDRWVIIEAPWPVYHFCRGDEP